MNNKLKEFEKSGFHTSQVMQYTALITAERKYLA